MKIIAILGNGSNQRALARRIHDIVPLAHVARVTLPRTGKRKILQSIISMTIARPLRNAWSAMSRHYDDLFADWPRVPLTDYISANDPDLVALIEGEQPDLVLVSGTDLLHKKTLDRFGAKVMNLHTGISPYIKGGPNCTNWALTLGEFDLIGNTIMWIDPGIDTGAIVTTEQTPVSGNETLAQLHIKVMDHAHDLYARAVKQFAAGRAVPAVPQRSIGEGRLFYSRQWDGAAMVKAIWNFRRWRAVPTRPGLVFVSLDNPAGKNLAS